MAETAVLLINQSPLRADNIGMSTVAATLGSRSASLQAEQVGWPKSETRLVPLNTRYRPHWDHYVRSHPSGTFFHLIAWAETVADVFGHESHSLMAWKGNEVVGVLPLFRVNSLLGGTMLVSVPYAVAGGILADTTAARELLWTAARRVAEQTRAVLIDFRSIDNPVPKGDALSGRLIDVRQYVGFKRALPYDRGEVLCWLPRKARAAARNGENKYHLTSEFGDEHLKVVWQLYCRSMRRLGSLCYPLAFFEGLVERNRADAHVQIAEHGGRIIGGLISFRFGKTFMPYFVGCDERFNRMSTNNFIYYKAMQRAVDLGCEVFDFGRSRLDNRGACDFKRFHGFEAEALRYQKYVPEGMKAPDLSPTNGKFSVARRLWRHLPPWINTRLGNWLSYHLPG